MAAAAVERKKTVYLYGLEGWMFAQNVIAIAGSVKTANVNLQPY